MSRSEAGMRSADRLLSRIQTSKAFERKMTTNKKTGRAHTQMSKRAKCVCIFPSFFLSFGPDVQ